MSRLKTHRGVQHLVALVLYAAMSVISLGLPIHFAFLHEISAINSTDPLVFLWWFARWPHTLMGGTRLFHTDLIWAPSGQNIAWKTSIPALAIALAPITQKWGPILSFNIAALTAPGLSAFGLYLVCRETGLSWRPSILGGWLFGFSTYVFAQLLGEINLAVVWAVPFLLWLFIRRMHRNINRVAYIGATAALAAFQFCVSSEVAASSVIFAAIAITLALASRPMAPLTQNLKSTALELAAAGALSAAMLAPYLYAMLSPAAAHPEAGIGISPSDVIADPLGFLLPTPVLWLGTPIFGRIGNTLAGNISDKDAYLGIPLIAILIMYVWEFGRTAKGRYISVVFCTFAILSLGSRLRILGQITPVFEPWLMITHLPYADKMLPGRFALYVDMAAAFITAAWYEHSTLSLPMKRAAAFLAVLCLLPNVDPMPGRGPVPKPAFFMSAEYKYYIQPNERVIILPYSDGMWFQATAHFYFRMVGGYIGGAEPRAFSGIAVDNALNGGRLPKKYKIQFRGFLKHYKVGAIIVYGRETKNQRALLTSLRVPPRVTGGVTIYDIEKANP